ncbi:MAG: uncharacterized protein A8A55_0439 [Amphiamblys sp. WSBS2006]|nr:MAG: uncharacterized protein A8A55_0439 [Amphiamblys sp. WSBS2006]
MFDLPRKSFAKHGDSFFVDEKRGVLIVSEVVLGKIHEDVQKERVFLFSQIQEVLEVVKQRVMKEVMQREQERHKELEEKGIFGTEKRDFSATEMCVYCWGEPVDGVFTFPLCEEAHRYACLECLDIANKNNCLLVCLTPKSACKANGDTFGMDEYRKAAGGNKEMEIRLSALVAQLQAPASFLLTCDLPNEAVLLTEKTTVTLKNIEISEKLFFVLLEKTRITVGKRFSISSHNENEDCIREHIIAREGRLCLKTYWEVSSLALENIERMPPSSIGCSLDKFYLKKTGLINILPKLRINKDWKYGELTLDANKKKHVAGILKQKHIFYAGKMESICLEGYAVGVITKMDHIYSDIIDLKLSANKKEHVAAVLALDQPFYIFRVERMDLKEYAVRVIMKIRIKEDVILERFVLDARKKHFSRILKEGDGSIELGRIRQDGFKVPEKIRRKLRYTLVDGGGRKVLEKKSTRGRNHGKWWGTKLWRSKWWTRKKDLE